MVFAVLEKKRRCRTVFFSSTANDANPAAMAQNVCVSPPGFYC
jgi:hypothetical protein